MMINAKEYADEVCIQLHAMRESGMDYKTFYSSSAELLSKSADALYEYPQCRGKISKEWESIWYEYWCDYREGDYNELESVGNRAD